MQRTNQDKKASKFREYVPKLGTVGEGYIVPTFANSAKTKKTIEQDDRAYPSTKGKAF